MNTIYHLSQYALQELKDSYSKYEIQSICQIIYMDVLHFTNIDIHLRKNEILDKSFINKFLHIIHLLKSNHPIQYILGETEFAGLRFSLNESTLIPRPETAELIHWVKTCCSTPQKIIDIGTGSGCIAITLAHQLPHCQISGIDISTQAVETAKQNADRNSVQLNWMVRDILQFEQYEWESFDVIVSNPPYVRESEKATMEAKVLQFEPATALFVPDEDPLLFYRRICEFGQQQLTPQGKLFFEINEALGKEMLTLMQQQGYTHLELRKDFYGKERMIKGIKE